MIEVFYYRNPASMERKTKEYVFIYIGAGLYAVVAYLIQHYFFSIMGENLTTRVRRMMLAGKKLLLCYFLFSTDSQL
jgi:ATP-binding cassette subfamily B (MDR/TAP) protein 1